MAQNIGKRRGKSPIKTRIEMERRAENKNPGSRASFQKKLLNVADTALTLSSIGPLFKLGKASYKGVKEGAKKLTKTKPPEKGPVPQGLKKGGCPHRENGAKSDIKGIKDIQVKGKKFIGVK